ncbi:type II toxin-antitoxin system RelE/ParE family toxin [Testudinibacter sp. P80/BLE/0925]|uniref:type II toxin-antitoxin system RelE/ParE family toxin n=1 Tax=Testudinibacter sp. TW-1 TaxID=3417757 RepID=UPI003D36BC7E
MAEIIWTNPALTDLNDIAEYIALENMPAAQQLVQNVMQKVERLALFPDSGRVPPELIGLNYREIIVPPCRIFYKRSQQTVYVLFVMRQERDLRKFMLAHSQ